MWRLDVWFTVSWFVSVVFVATVDLVVSDVVCRGVLDGRNFSDGLIHVSGFCSYSVSGEFDGLPMRAGDSYFASSSHVVKYWPDPCARGLQL